MFYLNYVQSSDFSRELYNSFISTVVTYLKNLQVKQGGGERGKWQYAMRPR